MKTKLHRSPLSLFSFAATAFVLGTLILPGCASTTGEPNPEPSPSHSQEPEGEPDAGVEDDAGVIVIPDDGGTEICPQANPVSSPVGTPCTNEGQICPSCLAPGPYCLDLVCRSGVWTLGTVAPEDGGTVDDACPNDAGEGDAGQNDAGNADAGTSDAGTSDAGATDAGASDAG